MEIFETIFLLLFHPKNSFFIWHIHYFCNTQKFFNSNSIVNENNEDHNKKWRFIPNNPDKMLINGCSGSGKTNAWLNLIKQQYNDNLILYLFAKDLNKPKYQSLIKKHEDVGIKHLNDPKAFIEYLPYMDDEYNNINDYNPTRKRKVLIVFDDMIADIMTNLISSHN